MEYNSITKGDETGVLLLDSDHESCGILSTRPRQTGQCIRKVFAMRSAGVVRAKQCTAKTSPLQMYRTVGGNEAALMSR